MKDFWFRHSENARNDPKIKRLTVAQKGVFYQLLELASQGEVRGNIAIEHPDVIADDIADGDVALLTSTIEHLLDRGVLTDVGDATVRFTKWDDYQGISDRMRLARSDAGRRSGEARRARSTNIGSTYVPGQDEHMLNTPEHMLNTDEHMLNTQAPSEGNIGSTYVPENPENEHMLNMAEHRLNNSLQRTEPRESLEAEDDGGGTLSVERESSSVRDSARARALPETPGIINARDPRVIAAVLALHLPTTPQNYQAVERACTHSASFQSLEWDRVAADGYQSQGGGTIRSPYSFMLKCLNVEASTLQSSNGAHAPPPAVDRWKQNGEDPDMIRHQQALEEKRKRWREGNAGHTG